MMIAIRAVMRFGWEVPNPITSLNPDNSVRFPFAVILPDPNPTSYNVTFTVNDDTTPTAKAIEGATVICAGQEKKTDSTGEAIFKVANNATYTYFVGADGKQPKMGKVVVNSAAASVTLELLGE